MLSLLLFILLVILGLLILTKSSYWSLITSALIIVLLLSIDFGLLPSPLLKYLQTFPYKEEKLPFKKKNAIVLLGGGVADVSKKTLLPSLLTYSRLTAAAQTYSSCKKMHKECVIITSGGDLRRAHKFEAHVYKAELLRLGIKASDIQSESKSRNTYQNAKLSSQLIKEGDYDQVFLVTSGIHMKRAQLSFAHFGVIVVPIASDYMQAKSSFLALGYNLSLSDAALHECLGILKYKLYDFNGHS